MEECNAQSVTHSEELEASCGNDRCYKESFHELDGVFVIMKNVTIYYITSSHFLCLFTHCVNKCQGLMLFNFDAFLFWV